MTFARLWIFLPLVLLTAACGDRSLDYAGTHGSDADGGLDGVSPGNQVDGWTKPLPDFPAKPTCARGTLPRATFCQGALPRVMVEGQAVKVIKVHTGFTGPGPGPGVLRTVSDPFAPQKTLEVCHLHHQLPLHQRKVQRRQAGLHPASGLPGRQFLGRVSNLHGQGGRQL